VRGERSNIHLESFQTWGEVQSTDQRGDRCYVERRAFRAFGHRRSKVVGVWGDLQAFRLWNFEGAVWHGVLTAKGKGYDLVEQQKVGSDGLSSIWKVGQGDVPVDGSTGFLVVGDFGCGVHSVLTEKGEDSVL